MPPSDASGAVAGVSRSGATCQLLYPKSLCPNGYTLSDAPHTLAKLPSRTYWDDLNARQGQRKTILPRFNQAGNRRKWDIIRFEFLPARCLPTLTGNASDGIDFLVYRLWLGKASRLSSIGTTFRGRNARSTRDRGRCVCTGHTA